jgi:hypothetical protein
MAAKSKAADRGRKSGQNLTRNAETALFAFPFSSGFRADCCARWSRGAQTQEAYQVVIGQAQILAHGQVARQRSDPKRRATGV